jgi:hypothetical protein
VESDPGLTAVPVASWPPLESFPGDAIVAATADGAAAAAVRVSTVPLSIADSAGNRV